MDKGNLDSVKKELGFTIIKETVCYFTITYILPIIVPLLTILIGYFSEIPWFWIWVSAIATFAFISSALLHFDKWLYNRRVKDKLVFDSVLVVHDIREKGIIIGIKLINMATFPIEFEVAEIRTQLGDKAPVTTRNNINKPIAIPPKGIGWYYDNPINILDIGIIEGKIEYKIDYGRSNAIEHNLSGKKQVVISRNNEGQLVSVVWNDLVNHE